MRFKTIKLSDVAEHQTWVQISTIDSPKDSVHVAFTSVFGKAKNPTSHRNVHDLLFTDKEKLKEFAEALLAFAK